MSCNATLFHSFILQCLVWGCKHPCSINCAIIWYAFRWTHITWWGWQLKLNLASSSELLGHTFARIGTFVAIILLLREDSYSSSAFPPCESQPIDLLRYRLALPVACPLGNWLVPVIFILRLHTYNSEFICNNAYEVGGTYFVLLLALRQCGLGIHSRNC